jgi:hypothetical protein
MAVRGFFSLGKGLIASRSLSRRDETGFIRHTESSTGAAVFIVTVLCVAPNHVSEPYVQIFIVF